MKKKGTIAFALTALVVPLGILQREHSTAIGDLSQDQVEKLAELRADLGQLTPGDMVSIAGRGTESGEAETYMVTRRAPPSTVLLSAPGPQSHDGAGIMLSWAGTSDVRSLMEAGTTVHHRGDDGWEQLAAWYYTQ